MVQAQSKSSQSTTTQQTESTGSSARTAAGPSNQELIELIELLENTPGPEQVCEVEEEVLEYEKAGVLPDDIVLDICDPLGSLCDLLSIKRPAVLESSTEEEEAPECAVEEERDLREEAPAKEENPDVYQSQMDNENAGKKKPKEQCSPTSLTMNLLALFGGDTDQFFNAVEPLLGDVGKALDRTKQPADAITTLLLNTDWDAAFKAHPEFFEHNPDWVTWNPGDNIIKSPHAQAYIASLFDGVSGDVNIASTATTTTDGETSEAMDFNGRWDWAKDAWDNGGQVSFQGGFTGSGHVVRIHEFKKDEMVVDDPYGVHLDGQYLVNKEAPTASQQKNARSTFEHRTQANPGVREQFEAGQASDKWGERNTFSKTELDALDALEWVLVIEPEKKAG